MPVKFTEGFKPKKIAEDMKQVLAKQLGTILSDEVTKMKLRIKQGQDVDGQQFDDYTPEYKEFKKKKGRSVGVPDLLFTGAMQQAITQAVTIEGSKIRGKVYFSSAKEGEKAKGNIKKRKFFGFSQEQIKSIKDKIKLALKGAYDRR